MRLAWATDLHLNFARPPAQEAFFQALLHRQADSLVLTGDIAEAPDFDLYLARLAQRFAKPIYFVLGNHDFYRSSVVEVRQRAVALAPPLHWLSRAAVIALSESTGLVGHDGWADTQFGRYYESHVQLNDFAYIDELKRLSRAERRHRMMALAAEAAAHFAEVLPEALDRFAHVVVATHVPPFREATWHEGRISDDDWIPFFASKIAGEAISDVARRYPHRRITVLCGHTHGAGIAQIAPNLVVHTAGAIYGQPALQPLTIE